METGSVLYGLVPIENSSIGPVLETVDALRTTHLCVRSMRALKIGHAIMGRAGLRQEDVKRVYSHEQVSRRRCPASGGDSGADDLSDRKSVV